MIEDADKSLLAMLGNTVSWLFVPLGFGNWQSTVATLMGLVAKEGVVSTFGVLFGVAEDAMALVESGAFTELGGIAAQFTMVSGYVFLAFNLLCAPCFAAMGAIRREMNSASWTFYAIGYQCAFAYCVALMVNQFGLLASGGGFTVWTGAALLVAISLAWLLVRKPSDNARTPGRATGVQRA